MSDILVTVTDPGVIDATVSAGGQVAAVVSSGGSVSVSIPGPRAAWGDVYDKPDEFPPAPHTHTVSEIVDWPAEFPPAPHTHTADAITDRATALVTSVNGLTGDVIVEGSGGMAWSSVPASATATGTAGDLAYDADYLYLAIADNTWRRVTLESWLPAGTFEITSQPADQTLTTSGGTTYIAGPGGTGGVSYTFTFFDVPALLTDGVTVRMIDWEKYIYSTNDGTLGGQWNTSTLTALWSANAIESKAVPLVMRGSSGQRVTYFFRTYWEQTPGTSDAHYHAIQAPAGWDGTAATLSVSGGQFLNQSAGYGYGTPPVFGMAVFNYAHLGGAVAAATNGQGGIAVIACRGQIDYQTYSGNDSYYAGVEYNNNGLGIEKPFLVTAINSDGTAGNWGIPTINANGAMRYWFLLDMIYGGGKFVALAIETYQWQPYALTSEDGLTWTQTQLSLTGGFVPWSLAYAAGKFVAVGGYNLHELFDPQNGAQNEIATSSDGVSWSVVQDALPLNTVWQSIESVADTFLAFGGTAAVGQAGNVAAISEDGTTWALEQNVPKEHIHRRIDTTYTAGRLNYSAHVGGDVGIVSSNGRIFAPIYQQPWTLVTSGGTASATLTIAYTESAGATVTLQWQTRATAGDTFADIAGETSTTLSLTGLTTADNGRQYRVRIERTGGSDQAEGITDTYYSDTATLTVS